MTTRVRLLLSLVAIVATLFLANCGHYTCGITFGSSTCTPSGTGITTGPGGGTNLKAYGYFVDFSHLGNTTNGLTEQTLNASTPSFVSNTAFVAPALPNYPTGLIIVQKRYMYIPSSDGTLFVYVIDSSTANITPLTVPSYTVLGGTSIAANPAGTLLFVGDYSAQQVSVFTINADGSLIADGAFATSGVRPKVMTTDGLGRFLYISDGSTTSQISAFSISSGGILTAVAGSPFSAGLAAISGEKSGAYLLGVSAVSGDRNVHVYGINSTTGVITEVQGSPFTTQNSPTALVVHPNGSWVYTFNKSTVNVGNPLAPMEAFKIGTGGTLTELSSSPYATITANGGPIEPTGQYMFALGIQAVGTTNTIVAAVGIDQTTGALTNNMSPLDFPGIAVAAYAVTDGQ